MSGLLTTDTATVLLHIFVHILVSNSSLSIAYSKLIECLVQTKIGHNCGHNSIGKKLVPILHVATVYVENMITCNDISQLIHTETAIRITIIGKANIKAVIYHKLLQSLNMSRTGIIIDIEAIWLSIDHIALGTERLKNGLSHIPGASVGTVKTDLHTLEGIHSERNKVTHIAVTASYIINSAADGILVSKRNILPLLPEKTKLSINIILHKKNSFLIHLLTIAIDKLDAVVIIRIVARRNHDTTVKIICSSNISHGRCGGNMQKICVRSRSCQTGNKRILKHIAGAPGVLSYNNLGRLIKLLLLLEFTVIPA